MTRRLVVPVLAGLCLLPAGTAGAQAPQAPNCPAPPMAYEGLNDVVREVRRAREDARAICLVARADAELAHADAELLVKTTTASTWASTAHLDAEAIIDAIEQGTATAPGAATGAATVSLDDDTRTWLQENLAAIVGALFVLIGLCCAAPFVLHFLRVVL